MRRGWANTAFSFFFFCGFSVVFLWFHAFSSIMSLRESASSSELASWLLLVLFGAGAVHSHLFYFYFSHFFSKPSHSLYCKARNVLSNICIHVIKFAILSASVSSIYLRTVRHLTNNTTFHFFHITS